MLSVVKLMETAVSMALGFHPQQQAIDRFVFLLNIIMFSTEISKFLISETQIDIWFDGADISCNSCYIATSSAMWISSIRTKVVEHNIAMTNEQSNTHMSTWM